MLLISHRGNLNGPNPEKENNPLYVTKALDLGYDVEIDVWLVQDKLYLGHDSPQYLINLDFLKNNLYFSHHLNFLNGNQVALWKKALSMFKCQ